MERMNKAREEKERIKKMTERGIPKSKQVQRPDEPRLDEGIDEFSNDLINQENQDNSLEKAHEAFNNFYQKSGSIGEGIDGTGKVNNQGSMIGSGTTGLNSIT